MFSISLTAALVDTIVEPVAEIDEAVDFSDPFASSDKVDALRGRLFLLLGSGLPDLFDIVILSFYVFPVAYNPQPSSLAQSGKNT